MSAGNCGENALALGLAPPPPQLTRFLRARPRSRRYLLVTDAGYKNVPEVAWEALANIDGDTE